MLNTVKSILRNQQGMQMIEAIGLAILGLVGVALIFNATKGEVSGVSSKLGEAIQKVNSNLSNNN